MTLRNFAPLALFILIVLGAVANYANVPPAPVVIIATFAVVILAFQVEDGKLLDIFREISAAFHKGSQRHAR